MPRLVNAVPKYRKHRASGQAVVTINYVDHYLGPHNSKASIALYDRLIAEYLAAGRQTVSQQQAADGVVVVQVLAAYWRHCKSYYVKDGKPTREQTAFRTIIRDVRKLYGNEPVQEFGPRALKAIRQAWIDRGHKRKTINANVHRVRRMFCWAASEEMIPSEIYLALKTVTGLRAGRSAAKESNPVLPVELAVVERTMEELQPVVRDMVRVQLLTGMRPEEVCHLRPCDLDRSREVWEYKPAMHKMQHQGRQRVVFIGPEAQVVLRPYLLRDAEWACFSPAESVEHWLWEKHSNRTTAESCGNRPGSNRKPHPQRPPRSQYDTNSYRRAIHRACDRAFPPPEKLRKKDGETVKQWLARLSEKQRLELKAWQSSKRWSPNQLRHTAATTIRKKFGLEAAQVILGHAAADVTQVYAERDADKAREVAKQIG